MEDILISLEYKNLTELLLNVIRQRPGLYLGQAKISLLPTFIIGYRMYPGAFKDDYFGENGFLEWMDKKYNIGQPSSWTTPFLDKANDNEEKALELYFDYLEEFQNEKTNKTK